MRTLLTLLLWLDRRVLRHRWKALCFALMPKSEPYYCDHCHLMSPTLDWGYVKKHMDWE